MAKTEQELKKLREETIAWNVRRLENGGKLTTYTCPCCHDVAQTPQPTKFDVAGKGYWDGVKTCYHCGEDNFIKTWPSGRTEVISMKEIFQESEV